MVPHGSTVWLSTNRHGLMPHAYCATVHSVLCRQVRTRGTEPAAGKYFRSVASRLCYVLLGSDPKNFATLANLYSNNSRNPFCRVVPQHHAGTSPFRFPHRFPPSARARRVPHVCMLVAAAKLCRHSPLAPLGGFVRTGQHPAQAVGLSFFLPLRPAL